MQQLFAKSGQKLQICEKDIDIIARRCYNNRVAQLRQKESSFCNKTRYPLQNNRNSTQIALTGFVFAYCVAQTRQKREDGLALAKTEKIRKLPTVTNFAKEKAALPRFR